MASKETVKKEEKEEITQAEAPVLGATDLVSLLIPKIPGAKNQDDVFISVNGKNYLIRRGVEVKVPKNVRDVYESSVKAAEKADEYYFEKASSGS